MAKVVEILEVRVRAGRFLSDFPALNNKEPTSELIVPGGFIVVGAAATIRYLLFRLQVQHALIRY